MLTTSCALNKYENSMDPDELKNSLWTIKIAGNIKPLVLASYPQESNLNPSDGLPSHIKRILQM